MDFKEIKEHGAFSGLGTILAHQNIGETKYHITIVTTTIPSVFGSQNTIEWSSTSNSAITHIPAKKSTEDVEFPFLWNADNIAIMNDIADKELKYAIINLDDGTGWEFKAKASYRMNEATPDSAREGILQLTITEINDSASTDLLADAMYMDTITFNGAIPQRLELTTTSGTHSSQEIAFTLDPSSGTDFTCSSSSTGITATKGAGKVTITAGASATTGYVTISATGTGLAGASRKIYVIVK